MKKNRLLRAATVLLVLTLITSCFVGGTFAKYTTSDNGQAEARVAHWGFNAGTSTISTLFAKGTDTGIKADGLLAPGTTGTADITFVTADAATNPEVAYKVTVDTTGSTASISTELEEAIDFYLDDDTAITWTELLAKIRNFSGSTDGSGSVEYAPGTAVPAAIANGASHTVKWEWAFERGADAADTALGNKAVLDLETLKLVISVTVEQLDTYTAP